MTSMVFLACLLGLFWYWFDGLRAHEIAMEVCKEMCRYRQVQLLDDTVMLFRTRLRRDHNGRLRLQRSFAFEITHNGADREAGLIMMLGSQMQVFELGEERTILPT